MTSENYQNEQTENSHKLGTSHRENARDINAVRCKTQQDSKYPVAILRSHEGLILLWAILPIEIMLACLVRPQFVNIWQL